MANFMNRLRGGSGSGSEGSSAGAEHSNSSALVIGKLIGAGGEGAVHEDRNNPRMVIKVLHPQQATAERVAKLRAMVQNPPQNSESLSWPNVLEGGVGELRFRMPRAASDSATVYRFISANERRQLPKKKQEYEYRATLGVNIAEAFRWLHAIHVRIGDVNPSNILVADDGSVTVIDCDSFQIPGPPGHQPYPCTVGSPEYTAPEIDDFQRQFRSQDSDNFALAVLLYQLLGNGSHPYQGIDALASDALSNIRERIKDHRFAHQPRDKRWKPTAGQILSWRAMPGPVQDAFRQAFSPGASHIGRPTSDAWASILRQNPKPAPVGQRAPRPAVSTTAAAPPAWQVGPQKPAMQSSSGPSNVPKSPAPVKSGSVVQQQAYPAMERACPKCKSHDARLRRDWYKRFNAVRCRNCNNVYGRTRIKRCPNCGGQRARLRSDWYSRGRPFRCTSCNVVFGGTDQVVPAEPVVSGTPNLARFLTDARSGSPDRKQGLDRARGVMLGVAVGNLLGLPLESRTRQQIRELYPNGVTEIRPEEMARPMDDDLAQAVELAEALLESGTLTDRFASRLVQWRRVNGRGMGRLTRQSIAQLGDKVAPPTAAYAVYRAKDGIASNGGIMRCPPVAVARRRQPDRLARDTADTCAVTHYAPACQWSCVIINTVISVLLEGEAVDLSRLLAAARADGCPDLVSAAKEAGIPSAILENAMRNRPAPPDTNWMLDNRGSNGHTLLTMEAGLWAATTPLNFEEALVALVSFGGDTDTNGALAGAVLGARYGASAIPLRWVSLVAQRERLLNLADRLANL